MTAYYGVNATQRDQTTPAGKVLPGQERGRVRIAYDEWAVPTAAILINSTVDLFEIPKGAIVLNAFCASPDQGTTGTGTLGWLASADAVEGASSAGLIGAIDFKANAACTQGAVLGSLPAGIGKKFLALVRAQLTITEAFDVGTGTIRAWAMYVLD